MSQKARGPEIRKGWSINPVQFAIRYHTQTMDHYIHPSTNKRKQYERTSFPGNYTFYPRPLLRQRAYPLYSVASVRTGGVNYSNDTEKRIQFLKFFISCFCDQFYNIYDQTPNRLVLNLKQELTNFGKGRREQK